MNVVCDLDGVVYLADQAVPGADRALETLTAAGANLLFATNNSTRSPAEGAAKIKRITGFPATVEQMLSSAQAAVDLVAADPSPVYLFGAAGARPLLADAGIEVVDDPELAGAVIIGLDPGLTYERLAGAVTAVLNGARFIATNVDVTYPTPAGLWPGAGALVAAVAAATGSEPEVAGKPHEPMLDLVRSRLTDGDVYVIGDRPETDVALGLAGGWQTILVLTGVAERGRAYEAQPDHIVESIGEAATLILEPQA